MTGTCSCSSDTSALLSLDFLTVYLMKYMKQPSMNMPWKRVITIALPPRSKERFPNTRTNKAEINTTGISLFITLRSTFIGRISDTMPIIAHILNILLPTTLPIAISPEPFIADMTLIASSGADVPNATTVRPTTSSEIPMRRAMAPDPSVSILAPTSMRTRPPAKKRISANIRQNYRMTRTITNLHNHNTRSAATNILLTTGTITFFCIKTHVRILFCVSLTTTCWRVLPKGLTLREIVRHFTACCNTVEETFK